MIRSAVFILVIGCAGPRASPPAPLPPKVVEPPKTYPARFLPVAKSEVEAREKAFRARNPEPWTEVKFDEFGLLLDARIVAPTPAGLPTAPEYDDDAMAAKWSPFLERNRDFLALDAPGMKRIAPTSRQSVGYWQVWGPHAIGAAQVSWTGVRSSNGVLFPAYVAVTGHGWSIDIPPPKEQTDDELIAPYVGLRGTLTTVYEVRQMPCDPPGGKMPNPCGKTPIPVAPPPSSKPYALARHNLLVARTVCRYRRPNDPAMELRIAARIDIRAPVIHSNAGPQLTAATGFAPDVKDPIPKLTDVVTGEDLGAGRCES